VRVLQYNKYKNDIGPLTGNADVLFDIMAEVPFVNFQFKKIPSH